MMTECFFSFCELMVQLGAIKQGDSELTFALKAKNNKDPLESDESGTPKKVRRTHAFNYLIMDDPAIFGSQGTERYSNSEDDDSAGNISPATPPIYNHRNARRRKGIPHRAPF